MNKSSRRGSFGSFRGKVASNASKQRNKTASYGHLILPRGLNVFKETAGKTIHFDILPYFVKDRNHTDRDEVSETAVEGALWYRRPYRLHRQVGLGKVTAVCLASFGKRCPICEYRDSLLKDRKLDWTDESVRSLKPSERNLYYVVPKGVDNFEDKPYLWDISQHSFQKLLNEEFSENEEFEVFPGLDDGLTLKVRFREEKTGDKRGTYAKAAKIEFVERNNYNYDVKVVEALTSLDEILDVKDYKTLEHMFFETEADADEPAEHDDDSTPPDDDDEDQVDDDIEEEDEPQDTRRRRTDVVAPSRPRSVNGGPATVTAMTRSDRTAAPERTAKPSRNQDEDPNPPKRLREASAEPKKLVAPPLPKKPAAAGKCPYGHRFGIDVDAKDECEECPSATWSACMDAHSEAA